MGDILSHQRSPLGKYGLGYAGDSSRKSDASHKASKNKNMKKIEHYASITSSRKIKERTQNNIGGTYLPRIYVDFLGRNKYHQRTSMQNTLKGALRQSSFCRYQTIFLGYCYYCTNFGHMEKDCRAYNKDIYEDSNHFRRIKIVGIYSKMLTNISYAPSFM